MARILVMDSDTSIRNLLREVLEDEGYSVVEPHNTYEGLSGDQMELPLPFVSGVMYLVAFR